MVESGGLGQKDAYVGDETIIFNCTIPLVPLFGNITAYFMDYDEQKCITEGFVGILLLATDDIIETPNSIIANPAVIQV